MSEFHTLVLSLVLYRVLTLLVGFASLFFGYRLFRLKIAGKAGELNSKWGDKNLVLKQGAPGTFFALFGVIIISVGIFKGVEVEKVEYHPITAQNESVQQSFSTNNEVRSESISNSLKMKVFPLRANRNRAIEYVEPSSNSIKVETESNLYPSSPFLKNRTLLEDDSIKKPGSLPWKALFALTRTKGRAWLIDDITKPEAERYYLGLNK